MPESVLVEIKRKEIELQTRLLAARHEAEELIARARDEAVALRAAGEAALEAEVRQLREAELVATAAEVARLREASARQAAALGRGEGLAEAVRRIVAAVTLADAALD